MASTDIQDLLSGPKQTSKAQELSDLVQYIRRIIPDQKQLTHMNTNEESGFAEFNWHTRHFLVKPSLHVFELKGATLMITGASQLMQAALRTKDRHSKVLGAIIENIRGAEESMKARPEKSFVLLRQVKDTLLRLAGKPAQARAR